MDDTHIDQSIQQSIDQSIKKARTIAATVPDPELPFLTLTDLGILRSVEWQNDTVVAKVAPTYSGCPALDVIEQSVLSALQEAGFNARVERVMSPPWTTDWITSEGHEKLKSHGICLLYTSPSPRDKRQSRMPSSA